MADEKKKNSFFKNLGDISVGVWISLIIVILAYSSISFGGFDSFDEFVKQEHSNWIDKIIGFITRLPIVFFGFGMLCLYNFVEDGDASSLKWASKIVLWAAVSFIILYVVIPILFDYDDKGNIKISGAILAGVTYWASTQIQKNFEEVSLNKK